MNREQETAMLDQPVEDERFQIINDDESARLKIVDTWQFRENEVMAIADDFPAANMIVLALNHAENVVGWDNL